MTYEFGDIVLIRFPQSGIDERKQRPALVVLDIGDADVVVVPITSRERSGRGDIKLKNWSECGLLRASWVRLAKVTCLEKIYISRSLGRVKHDDEIQLKASWETLYSL